MTTTSSSESVVTLVNELLHTEPIPTELDIAILYALPSNEDDTTTTEDVNQDSILKIGTNLGIHAMDLPQLARDFRYEHTKARKRMSDRKSDCINAATKALLLVCPDNATAWADRRRYLLSKHGHDHDDDSRCQEDDIAAEISYLDLLFTKHSKAPNAWSHRKWICRQFLDHIRTLSSSSSLMTESFFLWAQHEFTMCTNVAKRFPKNYYAWTHRTFVLRTIFFFFQEEEIEEMNVEVFKKKKESIFEMELSFVQMWLKCNVSDHSAAHYGSEVLRWYVQLFNHDNDLHHHQQQRRRTDNKQHDDDHDNERAMIIARKALESSQQLTGFYSSHEVLWIWRRICAWIYLQVICCSFSSSSSQRIHISEDITTKPMPTKKAKQTLELFVTKEIEGIFHQLQSKHVETSSEQNILITDEEEHRKASIHGTTYVLWIAFQWKRFLQSFDISKEEDYATTTTTTTTIDNICETLKSSLECNFNIPYNTKEIFVNPSFITRI